MSSEVNMIEALKGREVVYACLSRLFLEVPSESTYEMLKVLLPAMQQLAEDSQSELVKQGTEGISKLLTQRDALNNDELESFDDRILREYTRVYCLTDSVPISESVYTSVDHLSMQDSAGKVQALYDACSFSMKHSSNEPPDHISYELMFMAYLSKGTWQHLEKGNMQEVEKLLSLQRHFINEHMLKWLDDFVKATVKFPESISLYAPAAYFMLGYIREDKELLGE